MTDSARAYTAVMAAPFGRLGLRILEERLVGIDFLPRGIDLLAPRSATGARAVALLSAYFEDPRTCLELDYRLAGTPYRLRVWQSVREIECGATQTYGELAARVGGSPRAVGQALGDNPLPIVIPCHRVVGRQGLGGFAHARSGPSLAIKRWLLSHEGALGR